MRTGSDDGEPAIPGEPARPGRHAFGTIAGELDEHVAAHAVGAADLADLEQAVGTYHGRP
jgi:hypothetical protein